MEGVKNGASVHLFSKCCIQEVGRFKCLTLTVEWCVFAFSSLLPNNPSSNSSSSLLAPTLLTQLFQNNSKVQHRMLNALYTRGCWGCADAEVLLHLCVLQRLWYPASRCCFFGWNKCRELELICEVKDKRMLVFLNKPFSSELTLTTVLVTTTTDFNR